MDAKSTGMIRQVDKMGRVVIPKEIRDQLQIVNDVDSFEIFMEGNKVVLQKFRPTCIFCNAFDETVKYEGYTVCTNCIKKLSSMEPETD